MAKPRGLAPQLLSGMQGFPVEFDKRAVMKVRAAGWKCPAFVSLEARGVGVKAPWRRMPRAWASQEVSHVFYLVGVGQRTWTKARVVAIIDAKLVEKVVTCLARCFLSHRRHGQMALGVKTKDPSLRQLLKPIYVDDE